jgi:hypothetical protein
VLPRGKLIGSLLHHHSVEFGGLMEDEVVTVKEFILSVI